MICKNWPTLCILFRRPPEEQLAPCGETFRKRLDVPAPQDSRSRGEPMGCQNRWNRSRRTRPVSQFAGDSATLSNSHRGIVQSGHLRVCRVSSPLCSCKSSSTRLNSTGSVEFGLCSCTPAKPGQGWERPQIAPELWEIFRGGQQKLALDRRAFMNLETDPVECGGVDQDEPSRLEGDSRQGAVSQKLWK